jgi:hypothetical protein
MGAWQRFWATAAIWAGVTVTTIVLFAMQSARSTAAFSEPMLFGLVLVILGAAVAGTRAVWQAVRETAARDEATHAAKAKRSHTRRVERLIDSLDDEDMYDLEALLADREREQEHRLPGRGN